jgi:hypothetical protein
MRILSLHLRFDDGTLKHVVGSRFLDGTSRAEDRQRLDWRPLHATEKPNAIAGVRPTHLMVPVLSLCPALRECIA